MYTSSKVKKNNAQYTAMYEYVHTYSHKNNMLGHKFNATNIEHGLNFYSVYGWRMRIQVVEQYLYIYTQLVLCVLYLMLVKDDKKYPIEWDEKKSPKAQKSEKYIKQKNHQKTHS